MLLTSHFKRVGFVAAVLVLTFGCAAVRRIAVKTESSSMLDDSCLLTVFRSSDRVRAAGVSADGVLIAVLKVPDGMISPHPDRSTGLAVRQTIDAAGKRQIEFEFIWVGAKGSSEYRAYVSETMKVLQVAALERCSAPLAPAPKSNQPPSENPS